MSSMFVPLVWMYLKRKNLVQISTIAWYLYIYNLGYIIILKLYSCINIKIQNYYNMLWILLQYYTLYQYCNRLDYYNIIRIRYWRVM